MEYYEHKIVQVSDLIPYALNSRDHSELQVAQISASIREFGFTNPVLIDEDNNLIAGHGRVLAARKLDLTDVPAVIITGLDERKRRALIIADNKLALNATWDDEALKTELMDLATDYGSLMGFDQDEILKLLGVEENEGLVDDDAIPDVPEEPTSKLGDIYKLGNHRLMCGSACISEDVAKLMDGKKSDMVFTDPPYNVSIGTIKHPKFKQREILNDSMSKNEFRSFCTDFASSIKEFNDGIIYCWSGQGEDGRIMFTVLDEFFHNSTTVIWKKQQFTLGRGKYQNQYEPCWFGWNKNGNSFSEDRTLVNVWDVDRPHDSKLHPTMKPVELSEIALTHSSKANDIVLDLFGGSGSTMIACEKIGRQARLMELDPKYCDVIVKRWEDFTGEKAELLK